MNTILVWVLVSVGGYGGNQITYSQPMPDLATCEFLLKNTEQLVSKSYALRARCVQIRIMVVK